MKTPELGISVFTDKLLPISQTFILEQAKSLINWRNNIVGLMSVPNSISLLNEKHSVLYNSSCQPLNSWSSYLFKLFRRPIGKIELGFPNVIHAHFGPNGSLILPTAIQIKIPLITTFHGYDITVRHNTVKWSDPSHKLFTFREKELMEQGNKFIAVSDFIANRLVDRGYSPHKIVKHYIGVDVARYSTFYVPEKRKSNRIIFIGRLVAKKGLIDLVSAFELVLKKNQNAELVIIGDGPLMTFVKEAAKRLDNKIVVRGSLQHRQVLEELNCASILCVPSVTAWNGDSEAFGMVFAEAMCLRIPVVSHIHGGIPEVVTHGKTGLLAPEHDSYQLADFLLILLNDTNLREEMGNSGYAKVTSNFNIKNQSVKLEEIYNSVL